MRLIDGDALKTKKVYSKERHEKVVPVAEIDWMPTVDANHIADDGKKVDAVSVVRCGECAYRRRCMLQHFVESNAVDGTKIDWSEWYCAYGVRDTNVPSKSDERREE